MGIVNDNYQEKNTATNNPSLDEVRRINNETECTFEDSDWTLEDNEMHMRKLHWCLGLLTGWKARGDYNLEAIDLEINRTIDNIQLLEAQENYEDQSPMVKTVKAPDLKIISLYYQSHDTLPEKGNLIELAAFNSKRVIALGEVLSVEKDTRYVTVRIAKGILGIKASPPCHL